VSNLVTGLLVALVAGVFAVGGAVVQSNRSHDRWLREMRLEAYTAFLSAIALATTSKSILAAGQKHIMDALANEGVHVEGDTLATREDIRNLMTGIVAGLDELEQTYSRVSLVGPPELDQLAEQARSLAFEVGFTNLATNRDDMNAAVKAFTDAARPHVIK
jgi:hypothetical protein